MVGFILAEGPGRGFPAEDVDAVFDDGGCDPAPGRRKVSLARPPIGCGVVFLGDAEVLAVLAVSPAPRRGAFSCYPGGSSGVPAPPARIPRGAAYWRSVWRPHPAGSTRHGNTRPPL